MKKNKNILFFILIIFISGCFSASSYSSIAHKITHKTAVQLKKEKDLQFFGSGGGMMGDIQMMAIDFQYFHLVNLQEARELLVYAIQTYLNNINSNKEVRPYLHNYPFTAKNIGIIICILQPDGSEPAQGELAGLVLRNGILRYELTALSKNAFCPVFHKETYEEALKILAEKS